jgi:hypothetical protein
VSERVGEERREEGGTNLRESKIKKPVTKELLEEQDTA